MREAYRAVQRGAFDLEVVLENSVKHKLSEIGEVFKKETADPENQSSLKTIIVP